MHLCRWKPTFNSPVLFYFTALVHRNCFNSKATVSGYGWSKWEWIQLENLWQIFSSFNPCVLGPVLMRDFAPGRYGVPGYAG